MVNTSAIDMHNKLTAKIAELEAENKRLFDLWHNAVDHGNSIEMQLLDVQKGWAESRAELESRLAPDPRVAVLDAENEAMKAQVRKMIPLFSADGSYNGDFIQGRLWTVIDAANEASKLIAAQRGEGQI